MSPITRRQALAGVAGSLSVALTNAELSAQGQTVSITMTSDEIASIHGSTVGAVRERLGNIRLVTPEGFARVLALIGEGAFTPADRAVLVLVVNMLFDPKSNLDSLRREIDRLLAEAKAREVLRAVLVIARDSLEAVAKGISNPDNLRIAAIVGADVIGALGGIATAAKVSPHPLLLAIAAAAGATAGSVKAWVDLRPA